MNRLYSSLARNLILCLLLGASLLSAAWLAAKPNAHFFDFEEPFKPFAPAGKNKEITGALPQHWSDNSSWAEVGVNYSQISGAYKGNGALRIDVQHVTKGRVQVIVPGIVLDGEHFVEIQIASRSSMGTSASLDLRQAGPPYRGYWNAPLQSRPEWSLQTFRVPPAVTDPSCYFMIAISGSGSIEIDEVSIRYLTPTEALGDRDYTGNLLFSSSFAGGVQAPWALSGNVKREDSYVIDPNEEGPTGVPSLRIKSFSEGGRHEGGITTPFFGKQGETHTLSFWAKAEQPFDLHMRMGPPEEQLWKEPYQKNAEIGTEWKRHSFTLKLPYSSTGYYLARLKTHQSVTFWIDGLMVEAGETMSAFKRPGAGNVELALYPENHYSIFETGKPMRLDLAAYGEIPTGSVVKALIFDPHGEKHLLPDIALERGKIFKTQVELPESLTQANGTYVCNMQIMDRSGRLLGKLSEVLLHRIRPARMLGQFAPNSSFATHVQPNAVNSDMAKRLGFNAIRSVYSFNWTAVYRKGQWVWDYTDYLINNAHNNQLEIMGFFGGVPRQYSHAESTWRNHWWMTTSPPRLEYVGKFGEYAEQMMQRYEGKVQYWEVYNEPFLPGFFPVDEVDGKPVQGKPELLYEIAKSARAAHERSGSSALLLWNGGIHYDTGGPFDKALLEMGILELVDGVTIHNYLGSQVGFPGDPFEKLADVYEEKILLKNPVPFWNSEGGKGPGSLINHYRSYPPENSFNAVDAVSQQLVRYYLANIANGLKKVFSYGFFEVNSWQGDYSYNNVDGKLAATAPAISAFAWFVEGKQYLGRQTLADDIYAYYWNAGDDKPVALVLGQSLEHLELKSALPIAADLYDLYGNPVSYPVKLGESIIYAYGKDATAEKLTQALQAAGLSVNPFTKDSIYRRAILKLLADQQVETTPVESSSVGKSESEDQPQAIMTEADKQTPAENKSQPWYVKLWEAIMEFWQSLMNLWS